MSQVATSPNSSQVSQPTENPYETHRRLAIANAPELHDSDYDEDNYNEYAIEAKERQRQQNEQEKKRQEEVRKQEEREHQQYLLDMEDNRIRMNRLLHPEEIVWKNLETNEERRERERAEARAEVDRLARASWTMALKVLNSARHQW